MRSAGSDDPMHFEALALSQKYPDRRLAEAKSPLTWILVKDQAGFGPRYAHAAIINLEQHIFIIGGATGEPGQGSYLNDVWMSEDQGKSWKAIVPRSPRFSPRRGHAVVTDPRGIVFFVLGGFCGKHCLANDYWSSETGSVWRDLGKAPWSARHGLAAVMTSTGWLIVLGGHDGKTYLSDIWKIHDPAQASASSVWMAGSAGPAEWNPRYGHAAVITEEDEIVLLGGFYADKDTGHVQCFNDVWKSFDMGRSWQLLVEHAPWRGRYQHTAQINNLGHIFVTGGLSVDLERLGDVWRSTNGGAAWQVVTPHAAWAARFEHASVVDQNNTIYVFGGISTGSDAFLDVWRSEQTCADSVKCSGDTPVCRDGTQENFAGSPTPVCVGVCDRRIFDDCAQKEACVVQSNEPHCIDPCIHQECGASKVCEVAPRDEEFHGEQLSTAKAYCLSCNDAKTKMQCGLLRQCRWSTGAEACLMRCAVLKTSSRCGGQDHCAWDDGECAES